MALSTTSPAGVGERTAGGDATGGARAGRPGGVLLALLVAGLQVAFGQAPGEVVSKLDAWADLDDVLHVRWITSAPTKGVVEYGPTTQFGGVAAEDPSSLRGTTNNRDSGAGWASNHRADVRGIAAWPVCVRVAGEVRDGGRFESGAIKVERAARPSGRTARGVVPISVHSGGWDLPRVPVTVGVPFAAGELAAAANVRVLADGREIPSQSKAAVRWRVDNTVKWLRLDFLAPAAAAKVVLEYGADVSPRDYGPAVDVRARVGAELPLEPRLTDSDGKSYRAKVEEAGLEEQGPVKSVLRFRGCHAAADGSRLFAFTMRVHCWAWDDGVRVDYTFGNDNVASELTSIRALTLVRKGVRSDRVTVGVGDDKAVLLKGEAVLQREDFEWVKLPRGGKGRRLTGVADLGRGGSVIVRDFWQQWPISMALSEEGAVVGLCPSLPQGFYANRKDEDKLYYHVRDGLHTFRQGLSKTWEIWLAPAATSGALVKERPAASVPPEWIEDSGALRRIAVAVRGQFTGYDEALAKGVTRFPAKRDAAREYGMMNFGDWYGERRWNWGNLEYDLGHAFLTQFARTGTPGFYRRAEEILRHQRDIDTRHYAKDPRRIGQQWTHCMGHTAGYYPADHKNMKVYASRGWSDNRGHIWAQGMFEHYLLGGDVRSWETARLIADWAAGPQTTNFRFGNAREPGWMTKLVMSAYYATDDPYYLNAATIMLDKVREASLATGDRGFFHHKLPHGHCNCDEARKHYGEAGFMLGVLMTGMKMYYDATGDDRVADDIAKIARFIVAATWVPERLCFRYTPCPNTGASVGSAWIKLEGLAFGARRTGDKELANVCRSALAAAWKALPSSGKSAGYVLCSSAQALEEVAHLPGGDFAEYRAEIERMLKSPARRLLPTNVPNPDFETETAGWPSRGWAIEQDTEVKHSGRASLRISGRRSGCNEYVNTTYDTSGSPYEIVWLEPGATYRLMAWLRVGRISPGAPGPSLRLAFRDDTGTRGSKGTNAYDLTRLGTWQKLSADIAIPEWNTRNYIALNTNNAGDIDVLMHFDDVSLVRSDRGTADWYETHRLDPAAAVLAEGAASRADPEQGGEEFLVGPGRAEWRVAVSAPAEYVLWAKLSAGAAVADVVVNESVKFGPVSVAESTWAVLGSVRLDAGQVVVTLPRLPAGARVGRLVLTSDPGSSLPRPSGE